MKIHELIRIFHALNYVTRVKPIEVSAKAAYGLAKNLKAVDRALDAYKVLEEQHKEDKEALTPYLNQDEPVALGDIPADKPQFVDLAIVPYHPCQGKRI